MLEELIRAGGAKFLVPCIVAAAATVLAKGMFAVHQSRRSSRKDFLDVWQQRESRDTLWSQVAIRHLCGVWFPTWLIQRFLDLPQSGRAIVEVAGAWAFFECDDESKVVRWKVGRRQSRFKRLWEMRGLKALYVLLFVGAFYFVRYALRSDLDAEHLFMGWVCGCSLGILSLSCLSGSLGIAEANQVSDRWLQNPGQNPGQSALSPSFS